MFLHGPCGSTPLAWILLATRIYAQGITTTTTDLNGNTIIEDISTDGLGRPLATVALSTLSPTSSSSASTSTTVPYQGPIGSPTPTNTVTGPEAPTTYVYTTTDTSGNKTLVTAVFTPTFAPTSSNPSVAAGTILPYSIFTASFTTKASAAHVPWERRGAVLAMGVTIIGLFAGLVIYL
ncbi:hypothetical protein BS47DRAFT_1484956 [Hydnum rufescens UP504]|uniref:Uncharacterized protein n=1 Tax=Hydnum rufescens UP504 TaxID=1448309 RepID=A0A9P6DX82_9AGAM|nr:hypothetical protein BS47DRAFT_1484956 [Hydnum rufescens UP504]